MLFRTQFHTLPRNADQANQRFFWENHISECAYAYQKEVMTVACTKETKETPEAKQPTVKESQGSCGCGCVTKEK